MRFFDLLNFQHIVLFLLPAFIFILLFALALGFAHFRSSQPDPHRDKVYYTFPAGIQEKQAPFPVVLFLIVTGSILWAFFYILIIGLLGVQI
jgi:hypothetical protein